MWHKTHDPRLQTLCHTHQSNYLYRAHVAGQMKGGFLYGLLGDEQYVCWSFTDNKEKIHYVSFFYLRCSPLRHGSIFEFEIIERPLEATACITSMFFSPLFLILSLGSAIEFNYSHIITSHPQGLTVSLVRQEKA